MCDKCVRSIRKAKIPFGKVNFFAHCITDNKFGSIPLFKDHHTNLAIEGRVFQIIRCRTNKKKYSRRESWRNGIAGVC